MRQEDIELKRIELAKSWHGFANAWIAIIETELHLRTHASAFPVFAGRLGDLEYRVTDGGDRVWHQEYRSSPAVRCTVVLLALGYSRPVSTAFRSFLILFKPTGGGNVKAMPLQWCHCSKTSADGMYASLMEAKSLGNLVRATSVLHSKERFRRLSWCRVHLFTMFKTLILFVWFCMRFWWDNETTCFLWAWLNEVAQEGEVKTLIVTTSEFWTLVLPQNATWR